MITDPTELTPVELHNGLWYKREDRHGSLIYPVNGAKYRACRHLITRSGATHVVSAASVLSPQSAMAAVLADELGLKCTVVVGGTTPEKAIRHPSIKMAMDAGAGIVDVPVGYNTALQSFGRKFAEELGAWQLPYGITTPAEASLEDIRSFVEVGAAQTANLPDEIETLILPFGSGNTAMGVLYGLHDHRPAALRHVVLLGIGPDRLDWAKERMARLGRYIIPEGVSLQHSQLSPWWATYGDRMRETIDGIRMHPTYEGKCIRFLNTTKPQYWTRRDGTTCFWIVGGPID